MRDGFIIVYWRSCLTEEWYFTVLWTNIDTGILYATLPINQKLRKRLSMNFCNSLNLEFYSTGKKDVAQFFRRAFPEARDCKIYEISENNISSTMGN